jgi:hypothetical protein
MMIIENVLETSIYTFIRPTDESVPESLILLSHENTISHTDM